VCWASGPETLEISGTTRSRTRGASRGRPVHTILELGDLHSLCGPRASPCGAIRSPARIVRSSGAREGDDRVGQSKAEVLVLAILIRDAERQNRNGAKRLGRGHADEAVAQRAMSKRAGSTVTEVSGSHAVYVSQPQAVAAIITKAAQAAAFATR